MVIRFANQFSLKITCRYDSANETYIPILVAPATPELPSSASSITTILFYWEIVQKVVNARVVRLDPCSLKVRENNNWYPLWAVNNTMKHAVSVELH